MAAERKSFRVYTLCVYVCQRVRVWVLCVISGMKHHCCNNGIKATLMKEAIKWYLISSASKTKKHFHIFKVFFFSFAPPLQRLFCRLPADTVYRWPAERVLSSYWTAEFVQYGRDELRKCLEVLCHCCRHQSRVLDFIVFFALQLQRTFFQSLHFFIGIKPKWKTQRPNICSPGSQRLSQSVRLIVRALRVLCDALVTSMSAIDCWQLTVWWLCRLVVVIKKWDYF